MRAKAPNFKDILTKLKKAWHKASQEHAYYLSRKEVIINNSIWSDIVCGWHSGLSPCCILFFLFWIRLPNSVHYFIANMNLLKGFHYIPCPLCYIMNQRHVRTISCRCCPCETNRHELEWCRYSTKNKKKY